MKDPAGRFILLSLARLLSVAYNQGALTELTQLSLDASKSVTPWVFIHKLYSLESFLVGSPPPTPRVDLKIKSNELMDVSASESFKELYKCKG